MIGCESTFTVDKIVLSNILGQVKQGKIQLPDFQREWVWDDEHVNNLIESISLSYPIGTIMLLEVDRNVATFQPRPVDGTQGVAITPDYLILDGQQRLTSLFQSLFSEKVVNTRDPRKKPIKRWYYMDMMKAITDNGDRSEAIISLQEDKTVRNFRGEVVEDYSTSEREFEHAYFPLNQLFDCASWRRKFNEYWNHNPAKGELFDRFESLVIECFKGYLVPIIFVNKQTPKEAVCQVFEKVNTGGVSLTVFELLTATFAASNFRLRDDWKERAKHITQNKALKDIKNTDFLQAISLLVTYKNQLEAKNDGKPENEIPGVSCKRKEILKLTVEDYLYWADRVQNGFIEVAKFLYSQRIFVSTDLPYQTQLVPLAALFAWLNQSSYSDNIKSKLSQWYWCGVLGELYGSAVESRFARDLPELDSWIKGGDLPKTNEDANFNPTRLLTLRTRNSAAYKGVHSLLMKGGCMDWRTGSTIDEQLFFDSVVDIHHIFPYDWCIKNGIDAGRRDSIINKSPLSSTTNRQIQGKAPSVYLNAIRNNFKLSKDRLEEFLRSHAINPEYLWHDNFEGFFTDRERRLLQLIEQAMGKTMNRPSIPEVESEEDYEGLQEEGN